MALSAVRGRITARWAGVAALILGLAAVTVPPAAAAAGPAPVRPVGAPRAPVAGPAAPGSPWQLQHSPNSVTHNGMLEAGSCTGRGACMAVGGYENRSGTQVTLAEARTSTGWRIKATQPPAGAVFSNLFG